MTDPNRPTASRPPSRPAPVSPPRDPDPPNYDPPDSGPRDGDVGGGGGDRGWQRLEPAADRFEAVWPTPDRETVEAALARVAPEDRPALLRALIALEADLRRAGGEAVTATLYARFAERPFAEALRGAPLTRADLEALIAPDPPGTPPPRPAARRTGVGNVDQTFPGGTCGGDDPGDAARPEVGRREARRPPPRPPVLPPHLRIDRTGGHAGLLGSGGMGAVWAVRDRRRTDRDPRGEPAAAKVLLPRAAAQPDLLARFAREAAALRAAADPGVPAFLDYRPACPRGDAYILTARIAGETFEDLLADRRRRGRGACDGRGVGDGRLRLFRRAVAVLARLHRRGLVHRDVKPGNLMIGFRDARGRRRVSVVDFGLTHVPGLPGDPCLENGRLPGTFPPDASPADTFVVGVTLYVPPPRAAPGVADSLFEWAPPRGPFGPGALPGGALPARPLSATRRLDGRTRPGTVMGSPSYMAPEQIPDPDRPRTAPPAASADVCSLGLILIEILTGAPARDGRDPQAVLENARRGDLATAFDRLDACAARPGLVELAMRCVAFDPAARPADAGALLRELDALCVRDRRTGARVWDARATGAARASGRRPHAPPARAAGGTTLDLPGPGDAAA